MAGDGRSEPTDLRSHGPEKAPLAAENTHGIAELDRLVSSCFACPRLVAWRTEVARVKRAAFRDEDYWARPVPGFGPDDAAFLVVGLAPAAHGGNRTGRMFTGDQSGDVLFAALHAVGLATGAQPVSADDGIEMIGTRLTAPVHCAPPQNKPTAAERRRCAPFLSRELELLRPSLKVIMVLGEFGWQALFTVLGEGGWTIPRPRPRFGHGAELALTHPDGRTVTVLGCYHVSPHNTFTGRLTPAMLENVLTRAKALADLD
ncbi:uracil-DNA glycosylase [Nocardia mangyaensis]|uniref:Type-5 uracil-DNA glycosylase n=1 Tax=Nocardia mangyaensis TaxID=2213200 RepID=A0A1J0VSX7_9NOCA|nr:uracil-DNA glycosylase [Nocardia mangyaensis]APE35152.1 uracil-DNA glycosylase [Nocardia mangyaensis]